MKLEFVSIQENKIHKEVSVQKYKEFLTLE